jgi:nucleoside-diphosphate-sugar epimerase
MLGISPFWILSVHSKVFMRLFVTGGTGFIGTHFLRQALARGYEVIAQRRPGAKTRLPLINDPLWIDRPLDENFEDALMGCDVLVHLASHTPNPPYATLDECLYWNVQTSLNLASQAYLCGVKKFLIAGSCFEYGLAAEGLEYVTTNTPLQPTLSYPTSKAAASVAFEGFAREFQSKLKILRIFQVYGEGEDVKRFWPALRQAALAGHDFPMSFGEQVRDFITVEEVAKQFCDHLDFSNSTAGRPEIHHVASGNPQSLLSFAEYWWQRWQAKGCLQPGVLPYRRNEIMRLVPAPSLGSEI